MTEAEVAQTKPYEVNWSQALIGGVPVDAQRISLFAMVRIRALVLHRLR